MEECGRKLNVNQEINESRVNRNLKDKWELADGNLGGGEKNTLCAGEVECVQVLRQKELKVIWLIWGIEIRYFARLCKDMLGEKYQRWKGGRGRPEGQ